MNNKQVQFLNAMITCQTVDEAIRKTGISRSTAYRYFADKEFKAALREEQAKVTDQLTNRLLKLGGQAIQVLEANLYDEEATPTSRNTTAKTILDYIYRNYEQNEIIDRIDALERYIDD